MKINKKLKERVRLQKEVIELIDLIKKETGSRGLQLKDGYFANHLGITIQTISNMRQGRFLSQTPRLKYRLSKLKELYKECVLKNNII